MAASGQSSKPRVRLLAAVVGLLFAMGLSGCPAEEPCVFSGKPDEQPGFFVAGRLTHLEIHPLVDECTVPPGVAPTAFSVELTGPDQQPVPSQSALGVPPGAAATVEFTATQLGLYHGFAAFDPVGGIHQFDMYAARDRSSEAPRQLLGPECHVLERTRQGAWVCDTQVLREGAATQQLPSGRLAVSGDVVWVVDAVQIQRFEDDGRTLVLTASLSQSRGLPEFLLASEDELVMLHEGALQRITFDGTGLASTGVTPWTSGDSFSLGIKAPRGILLRAGASLGIVNRAPLTAGPLRLQVCGYRLDGSRFTRINDACQLLDGDVAGFEPNVLWLAEGSPSAGTVDTLSWLEWTDVGLLRRASLWMAPLEFTFPLELDRPAVVPLFTTLRRSATTTLDTAIPVHVPGQSQLQLEHLDEDFFHPLASPSLFWGRPLRNVGTASTHVRMRPSTP